jgi:hypothetical protein
VVLELTLSTGAARLVGVERGEQVLEGVVEELVSVETQESEEAAMGRETLADTRFGGGQLDRGRPTHEPQCRPALG